MSLVGCSTLQFEAPVNANYYSVNKGLTFSYQYYMMICTCTWSLCYIIYNYTVSQWVYNYFNIVFSPSLVLC